MCGYQGGETSHQGETQRPLPEFLDGGYAALQADGLKERERGHEQAEDGSYVIAFHDSQADGHAGENDLDPSPMRRQRASQKPQRKIVRADAKDLSRHAPTG